MKTDAINSERDFAAAYAGLRSEMNINWMRSILPAEAFLDAIDLSADNDIRRLQTLEFGSDAERRQWLSGADDREFDAVRATGRDIDLDVLTLTGTFPAKGDFYTRMLPAAARVLVARHQAAA